MRTITPAIETLLKSRSMIGANRPAHEVTVEGQPKDEPYLLDPTNWTTWRTFATRGFGNVCETSGGRAIVAYVEGNSVRVAFAPTIVGVLNGTQVFDYDNATIIRSESSTAHFQVSVNLIDGRLHMAISQESPKPIKAEYWRDSDGRGMDFAKVSDITADNGSTPIDRERLAPLSTIHKLGNGNLALCVPALANDGIRNRVRAHYSTTGGASWVSGAAVPLGLGDHIGEAHSKTLCPIGVDEFFGYWLSSSAAKWIAHWSGSGASYARRDIDYNVISGAGTVVGEGATQKAYMLAHRWVDYRIRFYEMNPGVPITVDSFRFLANFTEKKLLLYRIEFTPLGLLQAKDALLAMKILDNSIEGAGTEVKISKPDSLPVRSISISRTPGMASSASILIDNKDGQYSPDQPGLWTGVLWPNKKIQVKQGYGTELIHTFTGLIDSVQMDNTPASGAELTISCRDMYKKAIDQLAADSLGNHSFAFEGEISTAVAVWAARAGLEIGEIQTTEISMKKRFSWETWADIFQYCADLASFESYCDEEGKFHFVKDEMPSPVPDYTFKEGADIIRLGYRIDDAEIYSSVVVIGQIGAEAIIVERPVWYGWISTQKKLVIQAREAATTAICAEIADRAVALIRTRSRIVEWAAVAVPWLQIGDVVQVFESTSTISEIYRIKDMSFKQDTSGFTMQLTAYFYAHA